MIEEQYLIEIIALYLVGQEQGISVLNKAIAACTEAIERHKGKLTVKEEPRAVSATPLLYLFLFCYSQLTFDVLTIGLPRLKTLSSGKLLLNMGGGCFWGSDFCCIDSGE